MWKAVCRLLTIHNTVFYLCWSSYVERKEVYINYFISALKCLFYPEDSSEQSVSMLICENWPPFDLGTTKYLCLGIASTCVAVFSKLYRSDFLVTHCMYVCFILFFFRRESVSFVDTSAESRRYFLSWTSRFR